MKRKGNSCHWSEGKVNPPASSTGAILPYHNAVTNAAYRRIEMPATNPVAKLQHANCELRFFFYFFLHSACIPVGFLAYRSLAHTLGTYSTPSAAP